MRKFFRNIFCLFLIVSLLLSFAIQTNETQKQIQEQSNVLSKSDAFVAESDKSINISERLLCQYNAAIPSIELSDTGNANTIYIEETASPLFINSPAIVGMPIDISGGDGFTSATLSFKLQKEVALPVICRFSENGTSVYTTSVNEQDNVISANISSAGTYFVLDAEALTKEYEKTKLNILVILDVTGQADEAVNTAKESINSLNEQLELYRIDANIIIMEHFEMQQIFTSVFDGTDNIITSNTAVLDKTTVNLNYYYSFAEQSLNKEAQTYCLIVSENDVTTEIDDISLLDSIDLGESNFNEISNFTPEIRDFALGGEATVFLRGPIPIPVKLSEWPYEGSTADTDFDGIADIDELSELSPSKKFNLDVIYNKATHNSSQEEFGFVYTYLYNSIPTLSDSDYDGIDDINDDNPLDNNFAGIMHYPVEEKPYTCEIEFNVDYRDILEGYNTLYSKDLSILSSLLASDVYKDLYIEITDGAVLKGDDSPLVLGSALGLSDTKHITVGADEYSVDKDDVTDFFVGHRLVDYMGRACEVIIVSVRGTNETNAEWSSNFDVGADSSEYYAATGTVHPHWLNKENHKGFDVSANRVLEKLLAYIGEYVDGAAQKSILITGHSRGAAIANILGTYFEDNEEYVSYTYTFAAPNTTTSNKAASYKTIFNIKNDDDLIPYLPIGQWGFVNYGITKSISVKDSYESGLFSSDYGTFEWLIGEDYNNDSGTQRTLDCFAAIVDCREDLYVIDTSSDGTAYENSVGHLNIDGAQNEMAELTATFESEKLMRFCQFTIEKGLFMYKVKMNYSPAYLMQSLANMTTGTGPLLGHAISGKYATAKNSFIASSGKVIIGGMTHPHMQPTYYLLAFNNFLPLE